jgi:hypothetical protein
MSRKRKKKKQVINRNKISQIKLIELLKKHKRVKVVCVNKRDKTKRPERERVLTAKGSSMVRYSTPRYKRDPNNGMYDYSVIECYKWSRYNVSCFKQDMDDELKETKNHLRLIARDKSMPKLVRSAANRTIKYVGKDKAAAIVAALFNHDRNIYTIEAVYVGRGFTKQIV